MTRRQLVLPVQGCYEAETLILQSHRPRRPRIIRSRTLLDLFSTLERHLRAAISSNKMCYVVRVTNRCGHVNDHVQMLCKIGKPKSPSIHGTALEERTNRIRISSASDNPYLDASKLVLENNSTNRALG